MTDLKEQPIWLVCLVGLVMILAGAGLVWWVIPVPKLILMLRAVGFVFGGLLMAFGVCIICDKLLGISE